MSHFKMENILHLDGSAGLVVGILLLLLNDWVSHLYSLSTSMILFLATMNACYGVYALSLAFSKNRQIRLITLLILANIIWAALCCTLVVYYMQTASMIGLVFISLEGIFVTFLAYFEWRNKGLLSTQNNT
ncbi:hypothetical protein [Pseudoalteromonas luteoviolacea]|uniref:Uncharacterized protein n=1 Tax=Pseudoalteromonas luteoviolacea H33 TaxID=1365251 RepID=A0A167AWL0_9GAMM|nr:hypothetical protein [Pseudoalteromonas luteoviolacea]KZN45887.1 hypothetical protein N476_24775 [Pseudoalteromonas luteoviolacea H33]KZN76897.1 hypothetical protein N477_14065 [Pseudoalteromonas luteoviolacea H33-S]MBQ4879026.1 hypothetical protein [Pseudoalteromonas luteoviolacea]MBQ4908023.1 hypothetical protein [Pseudoalteromonas luteoviolacea]